MSFSNNMYNFVNRFSDKTYKGFAVTLTIINVLYFFVRARHLEFSNFLSQRSEQTADMLMKIQYLSLQTLVLENLVFITFISFIIYFLFKNGLKRNVHFLTFTFFYLLLLKYFIFIFATVLEVYPPDYFGQLQRPLDINFIFLIVNFFINVFNKIRLTHIQSIN